jgi:deoxyribose-phosphate aldolase
VAVDADARGALHPPAAQSPPARGAVLKGTSVDLARLIAIVAEEVMAAGRRPAARCGCHAMAEECCPTRLQGVIDAGAARLGLHAPAGIPAGVAGLIDHTLLKPDAARSDIEQLCREAAEFGFATVCVNPVWAALCARLLRPGAVGVCTVVGFPLGATTADVKHFETRRAIFDGAREVDMVINIGALKSGDLRTVERDIESVTGPCRDCGVVSKVIIEAAYLTDEEKVTACTLAKAAGADFVKTSTGFGPGGATVADVALMRRVVGDDMGVKAAGGVKDLDALKAMVAAGASRVGASAGVRIVQQAPGKSPTPAGNGGAGY